MPIPNLEILLPRDPVSAEYRRSWEIFIALCHLNEILRKALPLVYDLKGVSPKDTSKILRRIETDSDEWEDALPDYFSSPHHTSVSGSSSLNLCFLSLKMLTCRISLHVSAPIPWPTGVFLSDGKQAVSQQGSIEATEAYRFRQAESRPAVQAIVDFIVSLKPSQLAEFWLPCESLIIIKRE